ncbi:MAG: hypothetical protein CVV64_11060 [Candidatus Wallbacteria bacterium HGW-Wallbacteria-1]|jgi:voltage-gated potassium channel|uniref:Ion transport domain-containing protein n=1 Tax=Candidatus Wallbacteria bacterium HGW-Wallbacteria-1 TaxID=2013854 RepID=A0A2N1PNY1_9BACT|nr:MAG: hypothetical protein CVV64_11060 [Candidatus Wallbacteria bacterium HGW-Wallbacteria-1]
MSFKSRLYRIVFESDTRGGRLFDFIIISLILLSVIAIILSSYEGFRKSYKAFLDYFEYLVMIVFIAEYLLRLWLCDAVSDPQRVLSFSDRVKARFHFISRPLSLIDLFVILTFLLPGHTDIRFLRILRVGRLFRVFKLARYSKALEAFGSVLQHRGGFLVVFFFLVFAGLTIFSSAIYHLEYDLGSPHFRNIPSTILWAILVIGQMAPDNYIPVSGAGQILASFMVIIFRIGLICTFGGIFAAAFIERIIAHKMQVCSNPSCGYDDIEIDADYCPVCGEKINQKSDCCSLNPAWYSFCRFCGKKIA